MKALQPLFPHISRFISAVMVIFWTTVIAQNMFVRLTTPPFSSSFYDHSASTPMVLGTESGLELASWEKIIEKHPDYPDAYLMAAVITIKEQQGKQAHTFLNSFLEKDPNSLIGQKLLQILEASY